VRVSRVSRRSSVAQAPPLDPPLPARDTERAMSQENVELSLVALDAYNRRDAEALIALSDPDVVWSAAFERQTEGSTYHGHAGVREGMKTLTLGEFSDESHAEFSEWHDLGDRVLGLGRFRLRFASGVEIDQEAAALYTWRDGKLIEVRSWINHADTLEATGLSE
jgi:ketosteroid isomerase-like protein